MYYVPCTDVKSGRSSAVERLVANEKVVGSSPIARLCFIRAFCSGTQADVVDLSIKHTVKTILLICYTSVV